MTQGRWDRRHWSAFVDALGAWDRSSTGWHSMEKERLTAKPALGIQRSGWDYAPGTSVRVGPQFAWPSTADVERSLASQLQSWRFLDPVLLHHEMLGELEDLRWIADVVESWAAFASTSPPERTMAWTDWATTLRVPRLVTVMTRVARTPLRTWLPALTEILIDHAERLASEEYFNPRNNHGFFAAAAQLTATRALEPLLDVTAWRRQGEERLQFMLGTQFAPDGGHLEHSPSYHRLVLVALVDMIRTGLVDVAELPFRIEDAHAALAWMKRPDGRLVQFGDTGDDHGFVPDLSLAAPQDAYILSGGRVEGMGAAVARVFPQSGWVFVRAPAPAGGLSAASHLAWLTGFHSRAHKHADDLTFVWCEGGTEIVVDGGKFGYGDQLEGGDPRRRHGHYYASMERRYVESTRAHNTVSVGGDGQIDRLRTPYGSGQPLLVETDPVLEMTARARHGTHDHERALTFEPGRRLAVRDVLEFRSVSQEVVTAWLNLNGSFRLEGQDERSVRFVDDESQLGVLLEISAGSGEVGSVARGQASPFAGWRSVTDGELVPAWNIGIVTAGRPQTVLSYSLSVSRTRVPG